MGACSWHRQRRAAGGQRRPRDTTAGVPCTTSTQPRHAVAWPTTPVHGKNNENYAKPLVPYTTGTATHTRKLIKTMGKENIQN